MKTKIILITLTLGLFQSAQAMFVKDLSIDCQIKAKIITVTGGQYSPGAPPHGRFMGIAPSLTFKAGLDILEQSAGCQVLKDKYAIDLGHLVASGSKFPAEETGIPALQNLAGQTVEMKLDQHIGLTSKNGYLPLFPGAHKESLYLFSSNEVLALNVNLPFDLHTVYSIKKTEDMNDVEKLALAKKAKNYLFINSIEFLPLFFKLEPKALENKKTYAFLIWNAFHEYSQTSYPDSFYFKFHVGGNGFYTGKPLAEKLNVISHLPGTFSPAETTQLLAEFPTWLFAGYGNTCLNYSEKDLENALEQIKTKAPIMSLKDKNKIDDPIKQIAGKVNFIFSNCFENKVSPKAQSLALEILEFLK